MLKHILKRFDDVPAALRWIVLTVWMAVFLTYLLQTESHPVLSTGIPAGPPSPERDALFTSLHLVAYVFTTLLWVWTLITMTSLKRALMIGFVIVMSMGILTELGQTLTPDRHFQWIDLAANAAGMIIGLVGFGIFYTWWVQQTHERPLSSDV